MSGRLEAKCEWCEKEEVFHDPDADGKWREAGWVTYVDADGERDFCCLECGIAAVG